MNSCPACGLAYPVDFTLCPRDGAKLVEVGAWSDGAVIRGKYRILGKVGQGGMGSVYKALHLRFGEIRALKVIGKELSSDSTFVKRFEHEAVITRKLQHPNAVRVDDIDEAEDGRPFIVMEFIDGVSLKKLIQSESPLPAPRVCAIIKQAALALDAAHRLGMVHRDIKPDNIVLVDTPEGEQAKILDFGIAKVKETRLYGETSGMTLTGTGMVVGTPQYMSPEQAAGKRGDELDGRSDIYSLGIVMYQMLTRELPYKADTTMAMLLAHLQTPPTPIQTLRPELQIPRAIADVVMRCLEKDRDLRPANAQALIEELDLAQAGRPRRLAPAGQSQPRPATSPDQSRQISPESSRRWMVWVSTSLAAVLLAIGGWNFGRGNSRTPTVQPSTSPQSVGARVNQTTTAAPLPATDDAGESRNGHSVPPSPELGAQAQMTTPATSRRAAPPKPAATPASTAAAPSDNSREIEKLVKGAVTEGDFHYENGEYDEAIKSYQEGLKLDRANVTLRQKIQRAQKGKATEGAVKR